MEPPCSHWVQLPALRVQTLPCFASSSPSHLASLCCSLSHPLLLWWLSVSLISAGALAPLGFLQLGKGLSFVSGGVEGRAKVSVPDSFQSQPLSTSCWQ